MIQSLFGGSAIIATALVTATTLFYASPLVAEAALAPHTTIRQQQEPTSAQELKKTAPTPPAPLPEISLDSSEMVAAPMPAPEAPVAVPAPVDVLPAPPAPKPVAGIEEAPAAASQAYVATAYSLAGRTASGRPVGKGIIAADPRVLPLGTRVRLDAGPYSGEYLVADSGGAVKGRKIDVWVPSNREACRFGRRNIKLTVLSYGAKKKARGRN
jgi:3D (Asp-Asp-Asp) domain-containing protein